MLLRLVVERGEIRVQWPREDWAHAVPVALEEALATVDPVSARVTGSALCIRSATLSEFQ